MKNTMMIIYVKDRL